VSDYSQAIYSLDPPSPSAVQVRSLAAVLLPGLCSVIFVVALFQVLFLSRGTEGLFRDSDTGWHIRNGEAILAAHAAPVSDPFSYTRPGAEWFSWEWLSDVTLGFVHSRTGLAGVALLAAGAIALTAGASARLALSLGGNLFFTAAATVLLLGTTSIHWLARPHLFSWLLALAFVAAAEFQRRAPSRVLYLLPFVACVWANVHGSFLLGPAILLIYAVGEWLSGNKQRQAGLRFATAALTSLLATFINPYGWHLHEHVFAYLQNGYLMDHIAEYRSFNFHGDGTLYVELFLLVAIAGALLMLRQRAIAPALLSFAMLHMALYSARHLPTAAVLLLPLCVVAFTREVENWPKWRAFVEYSERLRAIDDKILGFIPIALALLLSVAGVTTLSRAGSVGFSSEKFPVRAVDFIEKQGLQDRIFAKDQWGGYLIYRFAGQAKVFIDGRSDFYGQNLLETQAQLMEVKPGWVNVLKQYDVRVVLVPSDNALAGALSLTGGWKRIYSDSIATVFERMG
jgi:hypothetical protein